MDSILEQWKTQNRLSSEGDFVYGNYNKVGFTVNNEDGGYVFVFTLETDSDVAYKSLQEKISAQEGKLEGVQVGKVESYLAAFVPSISGANDLSMAVDFIVKNSKLCGFYAPTVCAFCGETATKLKFDDGMVKPVCDDCKLGVKKEPVVEEEPESYFGSLQDDSYESEEFVIGKNKDNISNFYGDETSEDESFGGADWNSNDDFGVGDSNEYSHILEDDEFAYGTSKISRGSTILGILGALIGAGIGIVPYFLLYKFTDMPVAALCFVSGVLSVLLYRLFRGRKSVGLGMTLSVLFSIAAATAVVLFIQNKIEIANGGASVFSNLGGLLHNTEFLVHELMAVIGVILGSFVCKGVLNNYCE